MLYGRPVRIFHFEKSAVFRTLLLLRTALHKSCGRINASSECNAGRSGDSRSGLTRDYSKKLSSMETTRFDEENEAFLTAYCFRLQVPFTSPHSLSVNGSSGVAPGETIRSRSIVYTAAQGSQYTIHYANGHNLISILRTFLI